MRDEGYQTVDVSVRKHAEDMAVFASTMLDHS
jgi:hypothetical protein